MTPDDYDRLYEESREGSPFSNSSQGYGWMANNCDRCVHDKPARQGNEGQGCPLILLALVGRTPAQWLTASDDDWVFANFQCTEFRDENGGPGPEPKPIPTPPGQGELLPRADFEGHRMLTTAPETAVATP